MIAELIIARPLFYQFEKACEQVGVTIEKYYNVKGDAFHVTVSYRNTNDLFVLGMEYMDIVLTKSLSGHN